ncbi:MAG TPA: phosphatidate cytidylyltransferase [Dehalococcoidia bacterium]|nr:phosphatidate cytidylyltransferase [Dehalococcoidia bacterium]
MLKQRIFTAAVGVPLIILAVWFGDPWFSLLIAAVVLLGTFEFYHMSTNLNKRYSLTYFGLSWALVLALSPHYANILPIVMTAAVVISLVWLLRLSAQKKAFCDWAWLVAGVFYVGWMLSYWVNLRILEDGKGWVYLAILTTFANDTGAFFVGRAWGKHKLASAISPGKTWEGALGGLLSATMGAIIVFLILNLLSPLPLGYWQVILLGCLISLFAQLGDLVESLLKRNMEVKESGKLLPGHGGILDRFDSLIFVGAMVYYYVIWTV